MRARSDSSAQHPDDKHEQQHEKDRHDHNPEHPSRFFPWSLFRHLLAPIALLWAIRRRVRDKVAVMRF